MTAHRSVTAKPVGFSVIWQGHGLFNLCQLRLGHARETTPQRGDSGCKTRRFPSLPPVPIGVFTGLSNGNVRDKGEYLECLFACQFPECFSNLSPHHSDAFVSLLPGNKQRGRARSGSAQCPGTSLAEPLSNWVEARLLVLSGPSDLLSSRAELGGLLWPLGSEASRHLTMGMFLLWVTGLVQGLWWESSDLYLPCSNHLFSLTCHLTVRITSWE